LLGRLLSLRHRELGERLFAGKYRDAVLRTAGRKLLGLGGPAYGKLGSLLSGCVAVQYQMRLDRLALQQTQPGPPQDTAPRVAPRGELDFAQRLAPEAWLQRSKPELGAFGDRRGSVFGTPAGERAQELLEVGRLSRITLQHQRADPFAGCAGVRCEKKPVRHGSGQVKVGFGQWVLACDRPQSQPGKRAAFVLLSSHQKVELLPGCRFPTAAKASSTPQGSIEDCPAPV
jgi:hypothetical protein